MNKLLIIGISLILIPILILILMFAYQLISAFMEEVKIFGWKKALKDSSYIIATISISIGLILVALSV